MDLALLCDAGCEHPCAAEAAGLVAKEAEQRHGAVLIRGATAEEAALLLYRMQTIHRLLALLWEGPKDALTPIDFDDAPFRDDGTFRVRCEHDGDAVHAQDVEQRLGGYYHEKGWPVDLERPSMTLLCSITGGHAVLGVDLAGRDLAKRDYRAFTTRTSLRSTIAAAAVVASGAERIIDPSANDGTLAVEAALRLSRTSPHRFAKRFAFMTMPFAQERDWTAYFRELDGEECDAPVRAFFPLLRLLKMGRANAKLAGVEKRLLMTRFDMRWLGEKVARGSADAFVTAPLVSGKHTPTKEAEQFQQELFGAAQRTGCPRLLLISPKKAELLNAASRHGYVLESEQNVMMGGSPLLFLSFGAA